MPIIRCTLSKDGNLIPSGVEFEPGEIIHFKSGRPVHLHKGSSAEARVKQPFNLKEISVEGETTGLHINTPVESIQILFNPPPPPPNYVAVTIVIQEETNQAVTAG